jgi:hypothetical protein
VSEQFGACKSADAACFVSTAAGDMAVTLLLSGVCCYRKACRTEIKVCE